MCIKMTEDTFYLCVDISLAVIDDFIIAAAEDFLLRQLPVNPFLCFLPGDTVALHNSGDASFHRRCDTDYPVDAYSPVEATVKEYGTFEPVQATVRKVLGYGRVYYVVDLLCVVSAFENVLCEDAFLQYIIYIYVLSDKSSKG